MAPPDSPERPVPEPPHVPHSPDPWGRPGVRPGAGTWRGAPAQPLPRGAGVQTGQETANPQSPIQTGSAAKNRNAEA